MKSRMILTDGNYAPILDNYKIIPQGGFLPHFPTHFSVNEKTDKLIPNVIYQINDNDYNGRIKEINNTNDYECGIWAMPITGSWFVYSNGKHLVDAKFYYSVEVEDK
jgi:hypothetical protein